MGCRICLIFIEDKLQNRFLLICYYYILDEIPMGVGDISGIQSDYSCGGIRYTQFADY